MHLKTREASYRSAKSCPWRDDSEEIDWESLAEKPDPCIAACPFLDESFWKRVDIQGDIYKARHQRKIEKFPKKKGQLWTNRALKGWYPLTPTSRERDKRPSSA